MKKFITPEINLKTFKDECVITSSKPMGQLQQWNQETEGSRLLILDYNNFDITF